ncbi:MAG: hypothetical protein QOJ65_2409 [Fimbriimonadaceae bacterium]|jgi:hypothetical protein|nr:hypothetical protein [Fimbriimonadaceae bacterium]
MLKGALQVILWALPGLVEKGARMDEFDLETFEMLVPSWRMPK